MTNQSGFTLIEVLVALAILATTLTAGIQILSGSIASQQVIEESVLANWIATDAAIEISLSGAPEGDEFEDSREATQYGAKFMVHTTGSVDAAGHGTYTIDVYLAGKPAAPLARTTGEFSDVRR